MKPGLGKKTVNNLFTVLFVLKLYLLAYCGFRFAIEFIRIEEKWLGPLTYYQVIVAGFAVGACPRLRSALLRALI